MTDQSLAQSRASTTDPERQARLLEAAKAALSYLDDLEAHAPEGLRFGGEARLRRQLRQAIRASRS